MWDLLRVLLAEHTENHADGPTHVVDPASYLKAHHSRGRTPPVVVTPLGHDGCMGSMDDLGGWLAGLDGGLGSLSGAELADRLVELERVLRRTEAAIVAVVDEADRRQCVRRRWACVGAGVGGGDGALVAGRACVTGSAAPASAVTSPPCSPRWLTAPSGWPRCVSWPGPGPTRAPAISWPPPKPSCWTTPSNLPFEAFKTVVRRWEAARRRRRRPP